jgi:protein-disulfide isomerase
MRPELALVHGMFRGKVMPKPTLAERMRLLLRAACVLLLSAVGIATPLAAQDSGMVPASATTAILRNPGTPAAGAADPDVVMVEYFDYNCSYCKQLNPVLISLLEGDQRVSLVYKEWPILSETSRYAAESALAAGWQGKYRDAHEALMRATHLSSHMQIESLLRSSGVDLEVLARDRALHGAEIRELLQRNDAEAAGLGIRGTPGLLIGRRLVNGIYELAGLEQVVAAARRDR